MEDAREMSNPDTPVYAHKLSENVSLILDLVFQCVLMT